jgi:hypothetical protein
LKANVHLFLSVVDFSPVADSDNNNRITLFIEDDSVVADSQSSTKTSFQTLYIAVAAIRKFRQPNVDSPPHISGQLDPLARAGRSEDDPLHDEISHFAIYSQARYCGAAGLSDEFT